jgi:asparagine N-glycosylation enzyme membrane subunit Stt3
MRKRAQRKSKPTFDETISKTQTKKFTEEKKPIKRKKSWWIAITLVGLFLLVLFLNSYFNVYSEVTINPDGEGFEKFYYSGPDPYYNVRLVKGLYETGEYPYYFDSDPLLNYPIGARGARAPLFNMMAMGFSRVLAPFMEETEAIGYSMLFVPALFGALIVFVVYFIGKELFNKKAGIIGAFFIAIIPIHLGSGHGSAFGLFDHDSFNLLLFFLTFLFLIKCLRERDTKKSILYAILGGVPLAALSMTWVEARYLYTVIAIYAIVQMLIDIFINKIEFKIFRNLSILLWTGYFISLPVLSMSADGFIPNVALFICLGVTLFGFIYYMFKKLKIPWTISIPSVFTIGGAALAFIYFTKDLATQYRFLAPVKQLGDVIFGSGIYGKKVSMTIAEANTYQISNTVMSFGPAVYWIGWTGFLLLFYYYYKNKNRRDYLFVIILFIVNLWLAGIAGRFINDMVPIIAVLSGWVVWIFIEWIDYKQMIRNIKSAGGGFHGLRRGMKFLHLFGVLFLAFIVILPNAFVAFDAAVPNASNPEDTSTLLKWEMFGDDHQGAYGLAIIKEKYWADAFDWLSKKDTEIENPEDRPGFISWWDYGFYASALSEHPTVADNFQDGIPAAANFHIATSEKEAVSVWIARLLEGDERKNEGEFSSDVYNVLTKYLGPINTSIIAGWYSDYETAESFGDPIGEEYDEETSKQYRVGEQYGQNAVFHDTIDIINQSLTEDQVTWLYHDLQEATGWSIRYYGVEGYDRQIFSIFAFLGDKSLLLINGIGDDYVELIYKGYTVDSNGNKVADKTWSAEEIINMDRVERSRVVVTTTERKYKDLYFDTMFYRTYVGPSQGESGNKQELDYQIPCANMKHFYAEYFSDITKYPYYDTGKAAVVIATYYEGAYINGTLAFKGEPIDCEIVITKNNTYYENFSLPIDHDLKIINTLNENETGEFNLLAGADVRLQIRENLGQGRQYIYRNISFTGPIGSDYAPITDDDAMRRDGSNYERFLDINIQPANISGYVFNDTDFDGTFNASVDEPVSNINVNLFRIERYYTDENNEQKIDLDIDNSTSLTTDENGFYNASGLLPGIYRISATTGQFYNFLSDTNLDEGENIYNIVNAKAANIDGYVYYDENDNEELDSDEILADADVELFLYFEDTGGQIAVTSTKTDENGFYSFENLIPGVINGFEINNYRILASRPPDYQSAVTLYPEENVTTSLNISIGLAPVSVSGLITYKDEAIDNIALRFDKNESVEDNTAVSMSGIASDTDGKYTADLTPGSYQVNVDQYQGQTLVYIFEGDLVITKDQTETIYDIELIKESVTVSGTTSFEETSIDNVTVTFQPDESIENNTAFTEIAISDQNGLYSIELTSGQYNVTAISKTLTENDNNFTYQWSGFLVVSEEDISIGITFNIDELEKILKEE